MREGVGEQVLIAYFLRREPQCAIFAKRRLSSSSATCLNCSFPLAEGKMQIRMPFGSLSGISSSVSVTACYGAWGKGKCQLSLQCDGTYFYIWVGILFYRFWDKNITSHTVNTLICNIFFNKDSFGVMFLLPWWTIDWLSITVCRADVYCCRHQWKENRPLRPWT